MATLRRNPAALALLAAGLASAALLGAAVTGCGESQRSESSPVAPVAGLKSGGEGIIRLNVSLAPWRPRVAKVTGTQDIDNATVYIYAPDGAEIARQAFGACSVPGSRKMLRTPSCQSSGLSGATSFTLNTAAVYPRFTMRSAGQKGTLFLRVASMFSGSRWQMSRKAGAGPSTAFGMKRTRRILPLPPGPENVMSTSLRVAAPSMAFSSTSTTLKPKSSGR